MKRILIIIALIAPVLFTAPANSQDVYSVSSWESLFQWAEVPATPQAGDPAINEQLRYTIVLNVGQYFHMDFTNFIGLYSGLAIRNVGFIYDTDIPTKTIRRSYNLGIPLALKIGIFDKHMYIFGGGEYELLFHYKGKRWLSNERSSTKLKQTEWFSSKTNTFVPSVFGGIQLPGGFNIKYKYYLDNFLNKNYTGEDLGETGVSFANYENVQIHYISISWQFRTDQWKNYMPADDKVAQR
ncbi:hypothetical protein LCGC14_2130170 [marine sediment metagenome]|uniref:Outer membrane protein beta-barrel domain-containing protein n=1 Tax=marine sediment metagenome TaxID=412755 RepID=A0A0F9E1R4_9ZZZZ|nr:hypothetical protein [Bacteroides sp.]